MSMWVVEAGVDPTWGESMGLYQFRNDHTAVHVEYRGVPPIPVVSLLMAVLVLGVGALATFFAIQGLAPKLSDDWYLRFDWWWRIALYMMLFVGPPLLIAGAVLRSIRHQFAFTKSARWDAAADVFCVIRANVFGLYRRKSVLALQSISRIDAFLGEETGGPIEIEIHAFTHDGAVAMVRFPIQDVDLRQEAMDVFFSVARVCGLTHYVIEKNETVMLVASATRQATDGSQPIAAATQHARYDLDEVATQVEAPAPNVAEFDPAAYRDWNIRLDQWQPGKQARFVRPAPTTVELLVVGGFFGLLGGGFVFAMLAGADSATRWLGSATGAIVVALVSIVIYRIRNPRYEVAVDLSSSGAGLRSAGRNNFLGRSDIKHITLRQYRKQVRRRGETSCTTYQCRLLLTTVDGRVLLLTQNDLWQTSEDAQRQALEPLAAALAKELGVPWRWRGFREPALTRFAGSAAISLVLLGIIALVGFFGWGAWMQAKYRAEWDAVAETLRERGATVTRAGIWIGDVHIFGDGLLAEINDPQFSDVDLAAVLELLDPIPQYGLDLSNTAVTDEGLQLFVGRSALLLVNLRATGISPRAVETLAKTNLRCIDLRDTSIRLEHLDAWRNFYAVSILYIDGPQVTAADFRTLHAIPRLQAVLMGDEETTRQILNQRNEAAAGDASESSGGRHPPFDSSLKVAGEIRFVLN